jgi:hypothetical protein
MRARGLTAPLRREGGPSYREAKGGECYRSHVQPSQRNHRTQAGGGPNQFLIRRKTIPNNDHH